MIPRTLHIDFSSVSRTVPEADAAHIQGAADHSSTNPTAAQENTTATLRYATLRFSCCNEGSLCKEKTQMKSRTHSLLFSTSSKNFFDDVKRNARNVKFSYKFLVLLFTGAALFIFQFKNSGWQYAHVVTIIHQIMHYLRTFTSICGHCFVKRSSVNL